MQDFRYGNAKISQGLQIFRKDCENFTRIAKFLQAIIAKIS